MKQDFSPSFLWIALAFAIGIGMAMWGALGNLADYEKTTDKKYKEQVQLDRRAMKTIVVVDGVEREDCFFQQGTSLVICRPPLTPEKRKDNK